MTEAIVFGDIEGALVSHLTTELPAFDDTATVSVSTPYPRPTRFVTVRRAGGPRRDLVTDSPTIIVEAWAQTGSDALALCQLVRGIVGALPGETISGLTVYRVSEGAGPALLPDPESQHQRYTFTAQLDVRGSARVRSEP